MCGNGVQLRVAARAGRPRNGSYGLHTHDGAVHGTLGVSPMYQDPVAPAWLAALLDPPVPGRAGGIAAALRDRALALRIEPGRSLLDGCGMTVARVEHRRHHRDGTWSVGLAMDRTQCATAKPDHAIDPLVIAVDGAEPRTGPVEGWFTGAYRTEAELLTRRRLRFPNGVARGDLVVDETGEAVELDAVDRHDGCAPGWTIGRRAQVLRLPVDRWVSGSSRAPVGSTTPGRPRVGTRHGLTIGRRPPPKGSSTSRRGSPVGDGRAGRCSSTRP